MWLPPAELEFQIGTFIPLIIGSSYYCCLSREPDTESLFTALQESVGRWNDQSTLSLLLFTYMDDYSHPMLPLSPELLIS